MSIYRLNPDTLWDMYDTAHLTVRAGNTLYISGQVAVDEHGNDVGVGDVEAQIVQIYKNLENACRAHGGTLANIVKTNTYMTDRSYYQPVFKARMEKYGPNLPTNTGILAGLYNPNWLVEIEAIACLDEPIHRLNPDTMWNIWDTSRHTVRAGNTLYISGQVAVDVHGNNIGVEDIEAQLREVRKNTENACKAHEATLANIVQTGAYVTDVSHFEPVFDAQRDSYAPNLPANTSVLWQGVVDPEWLVEIEAVACIDTPIRRLNPETMADLGNAAHSTVKAGNTLYISGQVAVDEHGNSVGAGDIEAQLQQIYKNLESACRAHGGTLADIVKTNTYVTDVAYISNGFEARMEAYGPNLPTSASVVVPGLYKSEWLVQIGAVAWIE